MIRILRVLFDGSRAIPREDVIGTTKMAQERVKLVRALEEANKSYEKIDREAKLMKRRIDTALAIAISTGGIRE